MALPDRAVIVEVGARDGLQNEATLVDAPTKVDLIRRVVAAGVTRVETASFVHPKLVPQMADAEDVMAALGPSPVGASWIGLVLNRRGLDRALATPVDEVNFVVAASEGFNRANQGGPVEETMAVIEEMVPVARDAGRRTTATISVAFGCPFDGHVDVAAVRDLARRSAQAGVDEIALGDTIGVAVPTDVEERFVAVAEVAGGASLRAHFHDTRNTGVANAHTALGVGVSVIDASVGGAGGCPFAPDATGNVATEDVVYAFERMGVATGVDLDVTIATGRWLGEVLGRRLPAALGRAGPFTE
jgi:hydroxymethylglutaryl-CoA lyase